MSIFRRDEQQPEAPPSPTSAPNPAPARSRQQAVTLVAAGSVVEGKIKGNSEVLVEGVLEGEVDLGNTLVIGEGGKIIGDVVARSVRISGELVGNVQALDKVELLPTGSIQGDVLSPRVAIAEGGFCKGKIEMGPQDGKSAKPTEVKSVSSAKPAAKGAAKAASQPAGAKTS
ncbi:MAG: polymer-forming cytoskeletal protein [Acidobacteriota bacterium]